MPIVETLARDARYALRGLLRTPLFSVVALVTLAIGSGATTAVFSVVDGVLLKPLPYPHPEQLVAVWHHAPGAPGLATVSGGLRMSPSMLLTYQAENRSFERLGMWIAAGANVTGVGEPEQVPIVLMLGDVLPALGIAPLLGRWLEASDEDANGPARALLSYGYWQRRFGGDRSVVGRTITVNAVSTEIVGVMPRGFRVLNTAADLLVPMRARGPGLVPPPFCCAGIARLKPGVTLEAANADLARLLPLWLERYPYANGESGKQIYLDVWRITPAIRALKQDVVGNIGNVLWVVMGTIGVVLVIACANVMNLLLVRGEARRQELAVRSALGAGSWPIVRAQLLESLLLGLGGATLGTGCAYGGIMLLKRLAPATLPRIETIGLDARALTFAVAVAVLAGLVLGVAPALRATGGKLFAALRGGGRGGTLGKAQHRAQNMLVVVQVTLAIVLLVGSGLMIRTFEALRTVDPGFTDAASLQTVRIAIPQQLEADPQRVVRTYDRILAAIAAIPSVASTGFITSMPMEGIYGAWDGIVAEDQPADPSTTTFALRTFKTVSPGLFRTTGTPLVAGRDIEWADIYEQHRVAIVSERLARELWQEPAAAIGKRIRGGSGYGEWREVIGVAADMRDSGLQEPPPTTVYWAPYMAGFYPNDGDYLDRNVTIAIRTPLAGSEALIREVQEAVWSVNRDLPLASVQTMQTIYDRSLARTSFTLVMLAIAGAAALVLGVVGLYGVISYAVSQRRREIAIRLALGAPQARVTGGFVRYGAGLAGVGVAIGLVVAAGVTRLMSVLLYDVRSLDPLTYVAVALVLTAAAALASWLPARRAAAVDPAEALAAE
jgi:predicted permease